ncbi:alkane 1-monooxygenase [Thalassotalea euphylliae]|uniref:Alkane 1-monooxygenase n=1 Tax=Thalassotalea euphylliae TaxID=1655234 RepID=A0A3E0TXS0_9GAMM|nr:alkane 1-monooxygenase [Thalassotalea euphylliae]REL29264.1 alkane 1-monooxygenase [Thalassotalea euphylliae]
MNFGHTFVADNGEVYIDKKRYMWLLSLLTPLIAVVGPLLFMRYESEWYLWIFLPIWYLAFPLMDFLMGEDTSNPPESVIPKLEADNYYRIITLLHVPLVIATFIFLGWFVAHHGLSPSGYLAVALLSGYIGGHGLNIGHELGHKRYKFDRWMAKIVLAPAAYGHFFIEHNRGHHKHVATPEDPASAKMGESIYLFALRELPGGFLRAYRVEHERLIKKGLSPWTLKNEFIQTMLMTVSCYLAMAVWLGVSVIPYLLIAAFWSMWQLTTANYIEHYGLKRKKLASGRYEKPQPKHSWNSNHIFSNWALFHLQRHSDHHANAARSYQSLRHFDDLPSLPNGYFGMYIVAFIPWLWFKVMDKRLVAITGQKLEEINILPSKQETLVRKYGLQTR